MAVAICSYCRQSVVVPGPRNARTAGICKSQICRWKALADLAVNDLLTREEAAEFAA